MSITTSRASGNGKITIDTAKCSGCGTCVAVCSDFSLELKEGKATVSGDELFGCIACGQCVAVCTKNAIMVTGRTLSEKDFIDLPEKVTDYDGLKSLMLKRRSIREFKDKPVPRELVEKIIEAAQSAPMGVPPSDVGVVVIEGKEKVREFSFDFIDVLQRMKFMVSGFGLWLMRPFMKKEDHRMMKEFVKPLIEFMIKSKAESKNYLLYDAPLVMMFYGKISDPADAYIATTYAMLAAESLGLGSCMIGSIGPFLNHTGKDFKKKYGIPQKHNGSLVLAVGYPKYKFNKAINRSFAEVRYF